MTPNSLRSRMTATFAIAFAALILLFVSFILWFARRAAEQNADAALQVTVNQIQGERFTREQVADPAEWKDIKEDLATQRLALIVVDPQGRILQKTAGVVPAWPLVQGRDWRLRTVAVGDSIAVIGFSWQKIEYMLQAQQVTLIALSFLLLASATFGAWLLVGHTLSPIDRLSRQAEAASIDDLHIRLTAPSDDAEIVRLVSTLNRLLNRLSEALAARGRFYAAASHELRTPLQTLTGYLEVALMQPRAAEEYKEILGEASSQAGRLASLIQALLLLNQVEAGSAPAKEELDLAERSERWLAHFQSSGNQRGIGVAARLLAPLRLQAAPNYVDILLRNLMENAFKYAPPDSVVRVVAEATAQGASLTIFNECHPAPEWEESRLFEPFYRPDSSRNSETGGNGLGLAICKAIAEVNGWTISLHKTVSGVEATVLFRQ